MSKSHVTGYLVTLWQDMLSVRFYQNWSRTEVSNTRKECGFSFLKQLAEILLCSVESLEGGRGRVSSI